MDIPRPALLFLLFAAGELLAVELRFARYLSPAGSSGSETVTAITVDANDRIYAAGQRSAGVSSTGDTVVRSFLPDGSSATWTVLLGGAADEIPVRLLLDGAGGLYVAGTTGAPTFPGVPAADQPAACPCSFLAKLDAATGTTQLAKLWSGTVSDMALGADGRSIFLAGAAGEQAEIRKLNADGTWAWTRTMGGARNDAATGIGITSAGDIVVAGETDSPDFPTTAGAYQRELSGGTHPNIAINQFVAKLSPDASSIVWSTYFGGLRQTSGRLALGPAGEIYITGNARDSYVPWTHLDGRFAQRDLLARFTAGGALEWVIPIGDSGLRFNLAVDSTGDVWLGGSEVSVGRAVSNDAIQNKVYASGFGRNAQLVRISSAGQFEYGTFLGGTGSDSAGSIALDRNGNVVFAGRTTSPDFPVTSPSPQSPRPELYLAKIDTHVTPPVWIQSVVNGASFLARRLAPGEVISLFGWGLGPTAGIAAEPANGAMPRSLAGTRVEVNGVPAPLLYVSATQINAIVPYGVAEIATVSVCGMGGCSNTVPLATTPFLAGVFTQDASGGGGAAALNEDNSLNRATRPARRGSVLQIWLTGVGRTSPAGTEGTIATSMTGLEDQLTAYIGNLPAEVLYAGAAPGLPSGVAQVNVRVPEGAPPGEAALSLGSPVMEQLVKVFVE